jgi:hypothetical protein
MEYASHDADNVVVNARGDVIPGSASGTTCA